MSPAERGAVLDAVRAGSTLGKAGDAVGYAPDALYSAVRRDRRFHGAVTDARKAAGQVRAMRVVLRVAGGMTLTAALRREHADWRWWHRRCLETPVLVEMVTPHYRR